ncbi:MAG: transposase [Prochlorococcus sp.]
MARAKRLLPHRCSFPITLRCNSRQFLIAKALRRDVLLAVLKKAQQKFAVKVYGLCLMANHLHLLLKPSEERKSTLFLLYVLVIILSIYML